MELLQKSIEMSQKLNLLNLKKRVKKKNKKEEFAEKACESGELSAEIINRESVDF